MGRLLVGDILGLVTAVALALLAVVIVGGCKGQGRETAKGASVVATPAMPPAVAAPEQAPTPVPSSAVRGIPQAALRHRAELTRNARSVWGLDAPVATFAAQIHQESAWRADAKSPVGALGMAQFMPATADWISKLFPEELGAIEPYNPAWAMRALVTYDKYLWDHVAAATDCHRMAFALSAYNGGLGWVHRDAKLAAGQGLASDCWWDAVETVNAGRSAANWRENRGYPKRILRMSSNPKRLRR